VVRVRSYVYCSNETSPPKNVFIHLITYRAQREHKTNTRYSRSLTYPNHQNNCIKGLIIWYEKFFWTG